MPGLNVLDGFALYDWAEIAGAVVFIVAEVLLLVLRRRSIMAYLGH